MTTSASVPAIGPSGRSRRAAALKLALQDRILVLDGAMGTMIQRVPAGRERLPRRTLRGPPHPAPGRQRPALADPPRGHPRDPRGIPGRRGGHRRDQHLQRHLGRDGGLRTRSRGLRHQPGVRAPCPGRGRRLYRTRCLAAALRGGHPGAHQPHGVHFSRCKRPGLPQHQLRRARGSLRRAGARPPWTAVSTCSWSRPSSTP